MLHDSAKRRILALPALGFTIGYSFRKKRRLVKTGGSALLAGTFMRCDGVQNVNKWP